jgi:hypothetical protein
MLDVECYNPGSCNTTPTTRSRPLRRLLRFPEVRIIEQQPRPDLPSLDQEIAALYRRRYLTCRHCGGRGWLAGEITGRREPDVWEVSCICCGERWWIPKRRG